MRLLHTLHIADALQYTISQEKLLITLLIFFVIIVACIYITIFLKRHNDNYIIFCQLLEAKHLLFAIIYLQISMKI